MTILTTKSNELMQSIYDWMPVMLSSDAEEQWLSNGTAARQRLCRPYPEDDLNAYPVSKRFYEPSNDDSQVIKPQESKQAGLGVFGSM